jgi:tRNA(fMet)-specific endonuclease VapC
MKGHTLAVSYGPHLLGHTLSVSLMTVAELYEGAARARWSRRRMQALDTTLQGYLLLPMTQVTSHIWGRVRYERRAQPISAEDAWIAATALEHDIELVTHNAIDFQNITRLKIITEIP